jgi:hypothetical protein
MVEEQANQEATITFYCDPEDEGSMFLRNVGKHLPNSMASGPERLYCYSIIACWLRYEMPDEAWLVSQMNGSNH